MFVYFCLLFVFLIRDLDGTLAGFVYSNFEAVSNMIQ